MSWVAVGDSCYNVLWQSATRPARSDAAAKLSNFGGLLCVKELKKTFAHPVSEGFTAKKRLHLRQGNRTVTGFIISFCTGAAEACWLDHALQNIFFEA